MRKLIFILAVLVTTATNAADILKSTDGSTYNGKIEGVAFNFYNHVGVGLPAGETCNSQRSLVLYTTHPQYKEIVSVLLAAESSGKQVKMYGLGRKVSDFGVGYCVIEWAALGNFPLW